MVQAPVWYVYLLRCGDNSLYTGIARNVQARLRAHQTGKGARYTRGRGPLVLCASCRTLTHSEALRLEAAIKRLSRAEKEQLTRPRRLSGFVRARRKAQGSEVKPSEQTPPPGKSAARR